MKISTRYIVNVLALVAGAFLVVISMTFGAGSIGWLGFAVSTGVLVLAIAGMQAAERTSARVAHSTLAAVALWSLIAALVFSGPAMVWLVFADALAVATIALLDLTAHERVTERVVHELDVRQPVATG